MFSKEHSVKLFMIWFWCRLMIDLFVGFCHFSKHRMQIFIITCVMTVNKFYQLLDLTYVPSDITRYTLSRSSYCLNSHVFRNFQLNTHSLMIAVNQSDVTCVRLFLGRSGVVGGQAVGPHHQNVRHLPNTLRNLLHWLLRVPELVSLACHIGCPFRPVLRQLIFIHADDIGRSGRSRPVHRCVRFKFDVSGNR